MTEPVDWAPFASDGDEFRMLPPLGMTYCLTTDDIPGAKPAPATRQYLHGEVGDKVFPKNWLPKRPPLKYRNLETQRVVNPLDPMYKLASGRCLLPAGEQVPFSKRVTDLMDTSDIPGSKPGSICKRPLRTSVPSCYIDDAGFHPTKRTHVRTRTTYGQGLELFDIDIGKRQFGFRRTVVSNPLDPVYPNECEDSCRKHNWMKKQGLPPHVNYRSPLEKILDKITYNDFQKSLEQFGVQLSNDELNEMLLFVDKKHAGNARYHKFTKLLRNLDSWERKMPKRLGADLGCPMINSNLGQGLQVLVESKPKTRRTPCEGFDGYMVYNLFTGEPAKGISSSIPIRGPSYFSYAEQAAALSKLKHQKGFPSSLIQLPQHLKLPPMRNINFVSASKSTSPSKAAESSEHCMVSQKADAVSQEHPDVNLDNSQEQHLSGAVPLGPKSTNIKDSQDENSKHSVNQSTKTKVKPTLNIFRQHIPKAADDIWKISFPRLIKPKKFLPHPFKQRIHEERQSADLDAVHFLS